MSVRLYNGIVLPDRWPPRDSDPDSLEPMDITYLNVPPDVVPIDLGRQLFVDDFLIESTELSRTFYAAQKYEKNPILKPETELELSTARWKEFGYGVAGIAATFDDGVFFDPTDNLYKMWYMAGSAHYTALGYSQDGFAWERPRFDVVQGTNCVFVHESGQYRDSFSPWIDFETGNQAERYKAFLFTVAAGNTDEASWLCVSSDGIHWQKKEKIHLRVGDNSNLFYNPFRNKWVLGIRSGRKNRGRIRSYYENDCFDHLASFGAEDVVFWTGADRFDLHDPEIALPTQLYGISAGAYESLMLGVFTFHYGPPNEECRSGEYPKLTQLKLGFSRDGFHWHRPERELFIEATKRYGDWDRGYLRATGGGCVTTAEKLLFYFCGFSGKNADGDRHMYAGGSMHVATLRRDGFASMDYAGRNGLLVTRPVVFSGKHLFVNADNTEGVLRVAVLNQNGEEIEPFTERSCMPVSADSTCEQVRWIGSENLAALSGKPVRFRFSLQKGSLFSFWVSAGEDGKSGGFINGGRDR